MNLNLVSISDQSCIRVQVSESKKKVNTVMEEERLLDHVKANPLIYDSRHKNYRNQASRKETWTAIGQKMGKPADVCRDTWNKLRNAYTNAISRRKPKSGQLPKKMPKWIFEDQMSFLTFTRANRETPEESSRTSYETQKDYNVDDLDEIESISDDSQLSHPEDFNETSFTENIVVPHNLSAFPLTPSVYANSQKESNFENTRIECTRSELVSFLKNNSHMYQENYSQNPSNAIPTCVHDEDEMFFLSLAKFSKKLNPTERIRVKSEVSHIIFQAEYRNLQSNQHCSEQHRATTLTPSPPINTEIAKDLHSESSIMEPISKQEVCLE